MLAMLCSTLGKNFTPNQSTICSPEVYFSDCENHKLNEIITAGTNSNGLRIKQLAPYTVTWFDHVSLHITAIPHSISGFFTCAAAPASFETPPGEGARESLSVWNYKRVDCKAFF